MTLHLIITQTPLGAVCKLVQRDCKHPISVVTGRKSGAPWQSRKLASSGGNTRSPLGHGHPNMLPTLPEELLEHIFNYLAQPHTTWLADPDKSYENSPGEYRVSTERHNNTLFNVCLASKTFNRLASPALYRTYSTWPSKCHDVCPVNHRFLRTLCEKPTHGNALRFLSIAAATFITYTPRDALYNDYLSDDLLSKAIFQWVARTFWFSTSGNPLKGEEFRKLLIKSLMLGLDEGIICMILLLCPNITELDIELPSDYQHRRQEYDVPYLPEQLLGITSSLQKASPPIDHKPKQPQDVRRWLFGTIPLDDEWQVPQVLQKLEELTLRQSRISTDCPLLPHVLLLPSLQTLRICRLTQEPSEHARDSGKESLGWKESSHITKLHLAECNLQTAEVLKMIPFFPKLTVLNINWDESPRQNMLELGRAISRHNPLLQSLTLDTSTCPPDPRYRVVRDGDVLQASLKGMMLLKKLRVSNYAIWSLNFHNKDPSDGTLDYGIRQCLPPQIERLELITPTQYSNNPRWDNAAYERWQDRDLDELLRDPSFSRLRRVVAREKDLDADSMRQHGWTKELGSNHQGEITQSLRRVVVPRDLAVSQ